MTSLRLFRAGHLPVMGEWYALALIEPAGSTGIGDGVFDEIFHPISRRLVVKCDACLRIGAHRRAPTKWLPWPGNTAKTVYYALNEIPTA